MQNLHYDDEKAQGIDWYNKTYNSTPSDIKLQKVGEAKERYASRESLFEHQHLTLVEEEAVAAEVDGSVPKSVFGGKDSRALKPPVEELPFPTANPES